MYEDSVKINGVFFNGKASKAKKEKELTINICINFNVDGKADFGRLMTKM